MRNIDPEIVLFKMEKGNIGILCWVKVWCTYGHVNTRDQYLATTLELLTTLQLWKLLNLLISIIILTPEIKNVLVLKMSSYMHVYNVYMYPVLYMGQFQKMSSFWA
jgi:hypothetical protein